MSFQWATIGFDKNKSYFEKAVKNGRLGHAYLFWGPDMIGKRTFAVDLFRLINGRDNPVSDPDFKLISPNISEEETKIYIEDARGLKNFLSLKPYFGPYKFVVINDADRLTAEASNALLKVLEEPPPSSLIILITSNPKFLLSTILSRCSPVKFISQTKEQILAFLKQRKLKKDDEEFLLKVASGRLGWILNILEQKNLEYVKQGVDDLNKIVGKGIFEKMQFAKKIYEKGDYVTLMNNWANYLHADLARSDKRKLVMRNLISLNKIISQPQFNHRLALENFLINI